MPLMFKITNSRHRTAMDAANDGDRKSAGVESDAVGPPGDADHTTRAAFNSQQQPQEGRQQETGPRLEQTETQEGGQRRESEHSSEWGARETDALEALQKLSLGENGAFTASTPSSFGVETRIDGLEAKACNVDAEISKHTVEVDLRQPLLDLILAPAVLAHRYVRGSDVSLIVERPERVRAVLLGASAVLGRIAAGEMNEKDTPLNVSKEWSPAGATFVADDLVAQMAGMSMAARKNCPSTKQMDKCASDKASLWSPLQFLHSTKSASLLKHPAVTAVHAIDDDFLEAILPDIQQRRRAKASRHEQMPPHFNTVGQDIVQPDQALATYIGQLCSYAPHSAPLPPAQVQKAPRGHAKPTTLMMEGRTRSSARIGVATPITKSPSTHWGSQAISERMEPPPPVSKLESSFLSPQTKLEALRPDLAVDAAPKQEPVAPPKEDLSGSASSSRVMAETSAKLTAQEGSSSDSDDENMHPSEVPSHLSQGDLYLRGSLDARSNSSNSICGYGSREAIEHAIGASIAAVDRVVQSTRSSSAGDNLEGSPMIPIDVEPKAGTTLPASCAFVLTRPPGHHCSSSQPSGFCWVNNVAIAAQHAYQQHGVDRVCIFDIDLHHGNGTQKIAWTINEQARRIDAERNAKIAALKRHPLNDGSPAKHRGGKGTTKGGTKVGEANTKASAIPPRALRIYYSSLHDIESFPCEDSDPELVRDASIVLNGAHGQWITNVHLDSYDSPKRFAELYERLYQPSLLGGARRFLKETTAEPSKTLFLISCGFDACSYELPGMQRHNKHVPPGFYCRIAEDVVNFAQEVAEGKVVSLLEGGYGDRALCSGTVAHLMGLMRRSLRSTGPEQSALDNSTPAPPVKAAAIGSAVALDPFASSWFSLESLKALEKVLATATAAAISKQQTAADSRGAGGGLSSTTSTPTISNALVGQPTWVKEAAKAFAVFDELCEPLMRDFWLTCKVTQRRR